MVVEDSYTKYNIKGIENMKNIMKSVELEMQLRNMDKDIQALLTSIELSLIVVDVNYKDKLRDEKLIRKIESIMSELLMRANILKDIEHQAIKINDMEIYWKAEQKIAKLIETMEYIRTTYMF